MTWPLVTRLGVAAPGVGEDTPLFLWNVWWLQHALLGGAPLFTSQIMAPSGTTLALHGLTLLPGLLVLPISITWSATAALGVMALMNCTLNGAATFRLVHHLTGSRSGAFVAGAAFAYSPWAVGELQNHYNLSTLWPFVLFVDAMLHLRLRPDWRRAAELGVCLALMTYTDLQFLVLAVPLGVVVLVRARLNGSVMRWGAVGLAAGCLLALPLLAAVARDVVSNPQLGGERPMEAQMHFSGDLLAFWQPDPLRAGGRPLPDLLDGLATPASASQLTQLGYVVVVLALIGVFAVFRDRAAGRRLQAGTWGWGLVLALLLTLGPVLSVGREWISVGDMNLVLPTGLLAGALPVLNVERVPTRHMVTVSLALAVLAGFGVAWLVGRRALAGGYRRHAVFGVAVLALVGELWPPPLPLQDLRQHPYYASLATAGAGAVLEVPFGRGTGTAMLGNYQSAVLAEGAQTVHGHPLVDGYVSRGAPLAADPVVQQPFFRYLGSCSLAAPSAADALAGLAATGTRWVVVHPDWPRQDETTCARAAPEVASYLEGIGLQRVFSDDQLVVFEVVAQS